MSVQAAPLVSVVTPVYNGGKYLRECIESVIAQRYTNWRYTIVNNRSKDDSLQIARHYASRDSRIRVHDSAEFLPIIDNHNRAFSLIDPDSTYCKPVMADDWLYAECIEKMVSCARAHPSAGLVCTYALSGPNVLFQGVPATGSPTTFLDGRTAGRLSLLGDPYFFGSPSSMLIRSDLIRKRKLFYNPVNLHADEESCYDVLLESDFAFLHQVLSFYRRHEESQTSRARAFESILVGRVYALAKYGHSYLTDEEFERRYRERFEEYYAMLAASVLRLRGNEFWEYHLAKLALLGVRLDRPRLARAIFLHALRRGASPLSLAKSVRIWWPVAFRRGSDLGEKSADPGGGE